MTSRFSKPNAQATYKRHHTHEVVTSLAEGKQIAKDLNDSHRYAYRAKASLVGNCSLRPYDPIYLEGLPNGMSGYWTVLAIRHVFGGSQAPYLMEVELGTDVLGDVNPNAAFTADNRNIGAELAGQSLNLSGTSLATFNTTINSTPVVPTTGAVLSPQVTPPASTVAGNPTDPYGYTTTTPNFGATTNTSTWVSTSGNAVII